ncbi:hypothetical protein BJY52DRAFT_1210916 [Lactarius psammicola]|nr:hypothetical protein BJY52DRAFT_1210916 [Lactarius psammicola]
MNDTILRAVSYVPPAPLRAHTQPVAPTTYSGSPRTLRRTLRTSRAAAAEEFETLTANIQVMAGIISLLNDFLLSDDKAPLGFLNPWLYGDGLAGSLTSYLAHGFSAIAGWDPVTGQ